MKLYNVSKNFKKEHGLHVPGPAQRNSLVVAEYNDISGTERLEVKRKLPLFRSDGTQLIESTIEAYSIPGDSELVVKIAAGSVLDYVQQMESAKAARNWNKGCERVLEQFKTYAEYWHRIGSECTAEELLQEHFEKIKVGYLPGLLRIFFPPTTRSN